MCALYLQSKYAYFLKLEQISVEHIMHCLGMFSNGKQAKYCPFLL